MRIANQKFTVKSVLFSRPASFLYFLVFLFFLYKCITLLPIWLTAKDKAIQAEIEYQKKMELAEKKSVELESKKTDLGKERYQKDFFNKLDEGEQLIILYSNQKEKELFREEERRMFWWEQVQQDFLVWWRNLKN